MQVIITCRKWTKQVEDFVRFCITDPTVIVSSSLEILAYCKIPPIIHMLPTPDVRSIKTTGKNYLFIQCKSIKNCFIVYIFIVFSSQLILIN